VGCCGTLTENTIRLQFFFELSRSALLFRFSSKSQKIAFEQTLSSKKMLDRFRFFRAVDRFRFSNRDRAKNRFRANAFAFRARFRAAIKKMLDRFRAIAIEQKIAFEQTLSPFEQSRSRFRANAFAFAFRAIAIEQKIAFEQSTIHIIATVVLGKP
jgi:hypothetical protein